MKSATGTGGQGSEAGGFRPFVADGADVAEFTPKAILLGAFFAVLFGAATVYLALRAGVTVSASIPIAVLAIAVFKRVGSTILENNIVQTIGSAGESVAAGVVSRSRVPVRPQPAATVLPVLPIWRIRV
jgi:high-affinity Fe2+/Pb2+ permease